MEDLKDLMEKFEEAARAIARVAEEIRGQEEKTRAEEVRVFAGLLEKARPLFELVSAPILVGAEYGGLLGEVVRETFLPSQEGVVLVDEFNQDMPFGASPGRYGGRRLIITPGGNLLELKREGEWHRGERPDYWVAAVREITPAEAVQKYGFGTLLHSLIEAVEEAEKVLREKQEFLEARIELLKTLLQH